ncbi:MAG: 30S ribosomal protein S6 [Deltaproteobacteria bacterium]|nr:30S ribosomal protein S6 [Deltaproteobacteria bacterium]
MAHTLPKHRAREYETIFIVNPEIAADAIEKVASRLTDVIERLEGKLLRAENWGRRRLAYPVRKHAKGVYIYLRYLGYSDMVHEIERNMRMLEPVLKYLTVKVDVDVNPESRPVSDEDISFLPELDEEPERPPRAPRQVDEAETGKTETVETKAVETKAVETKAVETKAVETKAVETEAVETKPAENKTDVPAETEAKVETEAEQTDDAGEKKEE